LDGRLHPSKAIVGSVNNYLTGKCIILAVTGSVAAYKSLDLARWLMRRGARVVFAASSAALELVGEKLLHWASGEPPITRLTGETEHILYARGCDGLIVAPATLNTLVKASHGIADSLVPLLAVSMLGMGKPVVFVPAMHGNMASTPQYRRAISELQSYGALIVPPLIVEGIAKYPPVEVTGRVSAAFITRGRDLAGMKAVVTAGATREWIDPVRFISNPSSGRMGFEIAAELWARGASVTLIHGHMSGIAPHMVNRVHIGTTKEMRSAVESAIGNGIDIFVSTAAPADFAPAEKRSAKIKSGERLTLELEPTPKVVEAAVGRARRIILFAAETVQARDELLSRALEKMGKYGADITVANNVSGRDAGFGADKLDAIIIWSMGGGIFAEDVGKINKELLARRIIDTLLLIERGGEHG